ncbi:MAG: transglycosylase family protein [Actinomycetaceae bacterium]|nr:transglycosylase family protein [Actinomycetaceae bacterium]
MKQDNNLSRRWATNASRKTISAVAGASALLLVAGAGVSVATSHTEVLVNANGVTKPVSVWGGTVGGALEQAGVEVGEHDLVTPAQNAPVQDGQTITVTSAKSYTVKNGGDNQEIWSTAGSLQEVMDILSDSGRDIVVAANRSAARTALPAVLADAGNVTVSVDGKEKSVSVPADANVNQILEAAQVTASPIDQVYLESGEQGPVVNVIRQTRGTVTEEKELDFETIERETDELYEGESRVVQEGKKGLEKTVKYEQKRGEDVLVSTVIKEERTEPVDHIIERGTKERPTEAPVETSSADSAPQPAPQPGAGTGSAPAGVWAALAQCESGGNPATNTGNGYYGLYQFSLGTWQSVGGTGLPSDASAAEQTMRAQILQQRAGWGQWPACAASLGLL